jgi:hypothetical protein
MAESENLPQTNSSFPAWIADIPKALIPSSLKAFDRLLGAVVDYPVAFMKRETAKIDAQAKAFEIVESAIAKAAGEAAGTDLATIDRALKVLVRKEYRKQSNREAVVEEAVRELKVDNNSPVQESMSPEPPNEDWLNVFERFAEDASTDRMQGLWGRVLAGEIRKPGTFSLRTLRFLSEFSQSDAVIFAEVCECAIGQSILKTLAVPEGTKDIRHLLQLEAAGLITGAGGLGLTNTITFNVTGHAFLGEGNLALILKGEPNSSIQLGVIALTPLGIEVMSLIPNRDRLSVMRKFAQAMRSPQTTAAFIGHEVSPPQINLIEQLWLDEPSPAASS